MTSRVLNSTTVPQLQQFTWSRFPNCVRMPGREHWPTDLVQILAPATEGPSNAVLQWTHLSSAATPEPIGLGWPWHGTLQVLFPLLKMFLFPYIYIFVHLRSVFPNLLRGTLLKCASSGSCHLTDHRGRDRRKQRLIVGDGALSSE